MPRFLRPAFVLLLAAASGAAQAGGVIVVRPWTVGSDPFCAYPNITAGLAAAAAANGAQTLRIARNGTYTTQQLLVNDTAAVTLQGGYANCSQDVPSGDPTVLTGSSAASVIEIAGNGAVTLDRLAIEDGGGSAAPGRADRRGGGVLHRGNGLLTIRNSIVRDNRAAHGSAIAVLGLGALTLVDTTVSGNVSSGSGIARTRAAIHVDSSKGTPIALSDCTLAHNDHGALFVEFSASATLERCTVDGNRYAPALSFAGGGNVTLRELALTDNSGGGIDHEGNAVGDGNLQVVASAISGNCAGAIRLGGQVDASVGDTEIVGNCGSAVRVADRASLRLDGVLLQDNTGEDGGALALSTEGDVHVTRSMIVDNEATSGSGGSGGNGGGIASSGTGTLTIADTTISRNTAATKGGGLATWIDPQTGVRPRVVIGADVLVLDNVATGDGGGIHADGVELDLADAPRHRIAGNAGLRGGGVALVGAALARIGSGDPDGNIVDNIASNIGGGLWIEAPAEGYMFTSDGAAPAAVLRNEAGPSESIGGGIVVWSEASADEPARFFGYDVRIEDNVATHAGGLALLAYDDISATACIARTIDDLCEDLGATKPANARACDDPKRCNVFLRNTATGIIGGAAALRIGSPDGGGTLRLAGVRIEENIGRSAVMTSGSPVSGQAPTTPLEILDSVIARNQASNALFDGYPSGFPNVPTDFQHALGPITLERTTVSNNVVGAPYMLGSRIGIRLIESIIHQPGLPVHAGNASGVVARHVIASELGTLPVRVDVISADPRFVDEEGGDLRLQPDSPAIDFSDFGSGGIDLIGVPRGQDLPGVANRFGPRDLGAYEVGGVSLFGDGFEE